MLGALARGHPVAVSHSGIAVWGPAEEGAERRVTTVAVEVGVSYRQAWHWIKSGYVRVRYVDGSGNTVESGSGRLALIAPGEVRVLARMAQLVRAGLLSGKAAPVARKLGEGASSVPLGEGLVLSLAPEPVEAAVVRCDEKFAGQELFCQLWRGHEGPHDVRTAGGRLRWVGSGETWQLQS